MLHIYMLTYLHISIFTCHNWNQPEKVPRYSTFVEEWYHKNWSLPKSQQVPYTLEITNSKKIQKKCNKWRHIAHGESAIMRKAKLEVNFQVQGNQWDL